MAAYLSPDPIAEMPALAENADEFDAAIDSWTLDELDAGAESGLLRGILADAGGE
ncbi:hypothetical protein [Piscinibacter sakaiensis]|uniref:hypothetical protein n=1 Tax=Piscinibacter sakaiensis TaxID=1547922 RepID=UPI003AAFC80E